MNSKLTLSIDEEVIESVKIYAKKTDQSVSSLAENYFRALVGTRVSGKKHKKSKLILELAGIAKNYKGNPKVDYVDYLRNKYLNN